MTTDAVGDRLLRIAAMPSLPKRSGTRLAHDRNTPPSPEAARRATWRIETKSPRTRVARLGVRGLGIRIPEIRLELPTVQLPSFVRYRRGPEMHIESGRAPFVNQSAAAFGQIHTGGVAPLMTQSVPVNQNAPVPQSAPAPAPRPQSTPAPDCTPCYTPPHCTSEAKVKELRREMEAARERILALQDDLEQAVAEVEQDRYVEQERVEGEPYSAVDEIPEESGEEYRSTSRRRRIPRDVDYGDRPHEDYRPVAPAYDDEYVPEVEVGTRSRRPMRYETGAAEPVEVVTHRSAPRSGVPTHGSRDLRTGSGSDDVEPRTATRSYRPEADDYAARRAADRASVDSRLERAYAPRPASSGAADYEVEQATTARRTPTRYSEARTPTSPKATQRLRASEVDAGDSDYVDEAVAGGPYRPAVPRATAVAPKIPTARRPR